MGQQPSLPGLEDPCQAQATSVTALSGALFLGLPSGDSAPQLALSATGYGDPKSHGGWPFRPHSDRGAPAQGWPAAPAGRRRGGLRLDLGHPGGRLLNWEQRWWWAGPAASWGGTPALEPCWPGAGPLRGCPCHHRDPGTGAIIASQGACPAGTSEGQRLLFLIGDSVH